jgi:hypothetical protein
MSDRTCGRCNEPYVPREAKQRFCCRACSDAFFADERRRALQLFRAQRSEIECEEAPR